jgi:hypothetical protein
MRARRPDLCPLRQVSVEGCGKLFKMMVNLIKKIKIFHQNELI